ncbi:hypothetical protein [Pelolinea submarina]|uniref:Host cell surface-exposed lipoprotein n=1 Tax=Pelolinea submarina TaxID=913107 RepID=A0A347ZWQ3_9CHLR|nr:hypothetical protein [Pelolinea submarina]REG05476.1 hypothetical protein DFR64_2880 [Pelolinea submarina]BBB49734.1 hypothetical protein Pelsub_P2965 [Pelolinea submarina]
MNKKFKWTGLMVAIVMIAASATPVFAQSDTEPTEVPAVVEESSSFLDNPIVLLLSTFFSNLFTVDEVEETPPPDEGDPGTGEPGTGEPTEVPEGEGGDEGGEISVEEPTPVPVLSAEEQIAAMHTEDDLGFGEITKLLQIVTEAQESCELYGTSCDVTVDSLLAEYNTGVGMGELFAKYGKPEITGVGQTKKVYDEDGNKVKTNNGKANGKNK